MVKLTKDKAQIYLSDVAGEFVFWICDGRTLRNLGDLASALKDMNDDVFNYHVNKEKNDFAKWIHDVIGDKTLATSIAKLKTKGGIATKIGNRINLLKGA
jgi:hypothetical protein